MRIYEVGEPVEARGGIKRPVNCVRNDTVILSHELLLPIALTSEGL